MTTLDDELKASGFRLYSSDWAVGCFADLQTLSIDIQPRQIVMGTDATMDVWRVYLGDTRKTVHLEYNFPTFEQARHAGLCIAKAVKEINSFIKGEPTP